MDTQKKNVVVPMRPRKKTNTSTSNQISVALNKCLDVVSSPENNALTLLDQNPKAAVIFLTDELTKALNLMSDCKCIK